MCSSRARVKCFFAIIIAMKGRGPATAETGSIMLSRLLHAVVVVAVFAASLVGISWLTTFFTAERYSEGAVPSRLFPVLKPAEAQGHYDLLRWHQVKSAGSSSPTVFRLHESTGQFRAPDHSGYAPRVRFWVSEGLAGRQRVELRLDEDGYVIHAAYETDGSRISPDYLRVWGPSSFLLAVFPAFVLALVAARLLRRKRAWQQPEASSSVTRPLS